MIDMRGTPSSPPAALGSLHDQPRVKSFLETAVMSDRLSHAYLFLGAPGSGKLMAARALAQCVVCPSGGCGSCDECIRVAHATHPDVHVLAPASAQGYLVEQARWVIDDAPLAPVRAASKVYILTQAGLLRGTAANALLKTIEEPPPNVIFILCARSADAVLPTIASRCQQVPFRFSSSDAAQRSVELETGIGGWEARAALAVTGSPSEAVTFLSSSERRAQRRLVLRVMSELARDDSWDVLVAARELIEAIKVPLADLRQAQDEYDEQSAEFLSAQARKQLQNSNKRELTVRERASMMELIATTDSLLRDVLLRCEGITQTLVNEDVADVVERLAAAVTAEGVIAALDATHRMAYHLEHNVSPQLALETMLFTVKEALYARRHTS